MIPFLITSEKAGGKKGIRICTEKTFIDLLFIDYNASQFANVVKLYIKDKLGIVDETLPKISPIVKSKFKQLQTTGQEAELYFMHNFQGLDTFKSGVLADARLFGDGYDFQIQIDSRFVLTATKGIRSTYGSVRLTENEYSKAQEYKDDYGLVVVSNLGVLPKNDSNL